ncbi:MAG: hypothetical protein HKN21_06250 [Candidatus Eisenbacteria bacterium]|uniref:Na+-driven multidrug efflux pump n=1 Tax=Eiseniibacteriota bacterium TaxID=2212470 RepID=A0A7Y2E8E5_UNCEI|nr:hypothetical protein [Candidatus Eisenbacteria bacterium]
MNTSERAPEAISPPADKLKLREILVFFLPLAATSTMMSVSVPIIHAGLTRFPDAKLNLAAFSLAFVLGIFLESPVFALQQATIAWYSGRGKYRHLLGFATLVGTIVLTYQVAIAFSPLVMWFLQDLLGAEAYIAERAVDAVRIAVVFPFLIALRSAMQSILISRRNTSAVGWGTLFRLIALGLSVFFLAPRLPVNPPAAAMVCLALAVCVEMVYVVFALRRTPEVDFGRSPAHSAGETLRGRWRFIAPMMVMMALGTSTNLIISGFVGRTPDPETGLAAFGVIGSLVWFLASPFLRYSSATIALGASRETRRVLAAFVWKAVGVLCLLLALLHFTPIWWWLLQDVQGLTPELAQKVRLPLILLTMQPLVAAFLAYHQGVLTRAAKTGIIGMGGVLRVVSIVAAGYLGLAMGIDGALLGGILLGLAFASELLVLMLLNPDRHQA